MSGDIPIEGHELGPFFGSDPLGWWAVCGGDACGERFEGLTRHEVVDAYERHYALLALDAPPERPGPAKCKAALAAAVRRGKLLPPDEAGVA